MAVSYILVIDMCVAAVAKETVTKQGLESREAWQRREAEVKKEAGETSDGERASMQPNLESSSTASSHVGYHYKHIREGVPSKAGMERSSNVSETRVTATRSSNIPLLEITHNKGGGEELHSDDAELWCIDGTEVDLNGRYKIGGQLWYLRERALDARKAGRPVAGTPMNRRAIEAAGHGVETLGSASQSQAAKTGKTELKLEEAIPTELVMTRMDKGGDDPDVLEHIRKKKERDVRKKKIDESLKKAKG